MSKHTQFVKFIIPNRGGAGNRIRNSPGYTVWFKRDREHVYADTLKNIYQRLLEEIDKSLV